jgi:hypothetical protein
MTCVELQESLAEIESGGSAEQQAHLETCSECSALVKELLLIASSAAGLRAADEPSPRVWNAIEITLRREGLIHTSRTSHSRVPAFASRWTWVRWLAPATGVLLLAVGVLIYQRSQPRQIASNTVPSVSDHVESDAAIAGLNDNDLLLEISRLTPALQAQYTENLRRANQYIQDAKSIVDANPNDEEARRSLLEAYQQKAMLFELAMDRSLP